MKEYATSPFRKNIPQWGKVAGLVTLFICQYLISGFNGDMGQRITSFFGLDSDRVSFFLHISTVGMIAMFPLSYRFRAFFRRIDLLMFALGLQLLISLFCLFFPNETLLLLSSLLMGAIKIVCILDFLSLGIQLFPSLRNRGLLYGFFYGFSRTMQEVSTYITLNLLDHFYWTSVFVLSAAVAGFSILLCLLFFHNTRMARKIPLYQIDWWSVLTLIISGISMCYVLMMGKEMNWFASLKICVLTVVCLLSSFFFISRQFYVKRPYWNLRVFKTYKQVPIGIGIMFVMFFFHETSMFFHTYMDYNFKGEEYYLAKVAFIKISCFVVAFPLAGYLFYKGVSKRLLLCFGFLCYAFSLLYFSRIIQPALEYKDLYLPILAGSFGYAFTLTTAAAFASKNVQRSDNKDRAMGSIYFRYVLGSFVSFSLFSNLLFREIHKNSYRLAEYLNYMHLPFMQQFKGVSRIAGGTDLAQGKRQGLTLMAQKVDLQALLITLRDLSTIMGLLAIVVAVVILLIRKLEMHDIKGRNRYRIIPW